VGERRIVAETVAVYQAAAHGRPLAA